MTIAIGSTTDLIAACQSWLFNRADIAAQVPAFIQLFEAKMNRTLFCRQMENRVTITLNTALTQPQFVALPADFQTMRRIWLVDTFNVSPTTMQPRLDFVTGAQMDDLHMENTSAGAPVWFTLFGNEMEFLPVPDQNYQVGMIYRQYIPSLNVNSTNWLLTLAPDAYLYGTLMEAAPYLHEDERISVWAQGVGIAVQQLNELNMQALYNAGPLVIRRAGSRRGYG
jgi:hypothetical protein